jgi:hypothetical protein
MKLGRRASSDQKRDAPHPTGARTDIALLIGRQDHRHGLRMDRLDHRVLRKAVEGYEATVLWPEPVAPVRRLIIVFIHRHAPLRITRVPFAEVSRFGLLGSKKTA